MYHPGTGRFLSEDPLGFEAGDSNLYRYVENSPPNYTDPMGQRGVPVVVPEAPPAPLPVAPAQPTPTPRIPGIGVLGGAAVILLQDLLFPRPANFGEDEFLRQLNCSPEAELEVAWSERHKWPRDCQYDYTVPGPPGAGYDTCVYICKTWGVQDTIRRTVVKGQQCPQWTDWVPDGVPVN